MLINKEKIVILISTIIIAISTYSYGTTNGVITGKTVKLREGASMEADLIMLLSVDNKVEVLGQEGDWYKVKYKDNTGYVHKDYVKVEENTNNTSTETQGKPTIEENTTISTETNEQIEEMSIVVPSEKIIQEDTTISILPLINSSNIAILKKDTKVTVTEYKNGWVYVVSSDSNGWIRKEKLQSSITTQTTEDVDNQGPQTDIESNGSDAKENQEDSNENLNKTGYVNASSVRIRKEANTSSEILDTLVRNDKVTITQELEEWYKIEVNGLKGYIAKPYLSDKQVEVTDRSSSVDRTPINEDTEKKEENNVTNTDKKKQLVEYAKTLLETKYVLGGSSPKTGFDCSGFTRYVYKQFGYSLNRTSSTQAKNGVEVNKENLQLGDLVLFSQGDKEIGHVGIYIGENKFIHAANEKKGVVITSLSNSYYTTNYVTARRIIN